MTVFSFFFFKQKTAYEMRISDRSSDVCSSDLRVVDLDRMRSFYKEVLGCTDEREQPEIGLYQLRAGHALIDLITIAGKLGAMGGAAPGTEIGRASCRARVCQSV